MEIPPFPHPRKFPQNANVHQHSRAQVREPTATPTKLHSSTATPTPHASRCAGSVRIRPSRKAHT